MSIVRQSLDGIHLQLQRLNRPVISLLQPGIDRTHVQRAASQLTLTLPEAVTELYSWHNGTNLNAATLNDANIFPGYYLMSIEEAVGHYSANPSTNPLWKPKWFPLFCSGGGDYYAIQCGVCTSDDAGIVWYFRGNSDHPIIYQGLISMLRTLEACFANKVFTVEEERLTSDFQREIEIARLCNPDLSYWRS